MSAIFIIFYVAATLLFFHDGKKRFIIDDWLVMIGEQIFGTLLIARIISGVLAS